MRSSSPLRSKSPVNHYTPQQVEYRASLNQSYAKYNVEKENTDPVKHRNMTTGQFLGSTAAESRYQMEQQRYSQYASRFVAPGPDLGVHLRPLVSCHQDYFINELTQEVNELRSRQRDFAMLQEQYKHLQQEFNSIQFEKQQFETQCLSKIAQDRQEVDMLIRELDQVKLENQQCDDEQVRLLETIGVTENDVYQASMELSDTRTAATQHDSVNLNLKKEIDYEQQLVNEQKELSNRNYQELSRLREIMYNLDKDLEAKSKRIEILRREVENNGQRTNSITDVLDSKEDAIARTQQKISEAYQQIQDLKYTLNKLDGELSYFENLNEQHKNAQTQMFKGNEYEYQAGKENSLKCQEYEITLNKLTQDEQSVSYEIDRLKQHSEQMLKDQIDLQAEIEALDRHMASLNNQNYCLQKELEEFVQADDQVKKNLDRKYKVDHIRQRVDDVIARSQAEVDYQRQYGHNREQVNHEIAKGMHYERVKSANHYSPAREEKMRRTAWGAPDSKIGEQMSFGREKIEQERESRFGGYKENYRENQYERKSGSPLRASPRSKSFGKMVSFAR